MGFGCVLGCVDSRVPPETVFDQGIGDIFSARIAGNFINNDILGSMEFTTKLAGVKLVVVMGHTACGAVKGACDNAELGILTGMLAKIRPAIAATPPPNNGDTSSKNADFVNAVAETNVKMAVEGIYTQSKVIADMVDAGEVAIVGAMYDICTGAVTFYE